MPSNNIPYGRLEGIEHSELPAAVIFSVIYAPLLIVYLTLSFRKPTFVWRSLVVFCLFRMVGFILRAVIAASISASTSLGLVISQQVIYNIGFFGLLYSAYTLVLDRDLLTHGPATEARGPIGVFIGGLRRTRMLVRIALLAAIALGIVSGMKQGHTNADDQQTALDLRRGSLYIFLVVSCLLLIMTIILAGEELSTDRRYGPKHGTFVLLLIGVLCVVREAFLCATASTFPQHNKAAWFYPLVAVTELICALLFLVPRLVPSRQELMEAGIRNEKGKPNYNGGMSNTVGGRQNVYPIPV